MMSSRQPDLAWVTETQNGSSMDLDRRSTHEIVETFAAADAAVAQAVAAVSADIAAAVDIVVSALSVGGVLHYVGSGTSGRMGVLDAVELWPTFRVDESQVRAHLAGGPDAMVRAAEGAEDEKEPGRSIAAEAGEHDVIVGITASGRTPFVEGALAEARRRGLATILLSTNPEAPLACFADVAILPVTGPEVLTGSTRLKSATAQKLVLNTLSTAAMIRLGKTYSNLMIDMVPTNVKLRARSVRMLQQAAEVSAAEAADALAQAEGRVRVALVSLLAGAPAAAAAEVLEGYPADPARPGDPSGIRTAVAALKGPE